MPVKNVYFFRRYCYYLFNDLLSVLCLNRDKTLIINVSRYLHFARNSFLHPKCVLKAFLFSICRGECVLGQKSDPETRGPSARCQG